MARKLFVVGLCIMAFSLLAISEGSCQQVSDSAYWSSLINQENSLCASLLYLPYMVFSGPVRIIDGIQNPKPTTWATIPPAAHRIPPH
ncbi:MAG: hypothetical protein P8182_18450 [Deltaproteobacteria bacterium]